MELSFIYYSILLLNAVVFLTGKKFKLISIPSALFLILFVMGKRFDNSFIAYDLDNYQLRYENTTGFGTLELGYDLINNIGIFFGLSFEQFYMILVAITMIAIFIAVIRIGGNLHLFIVSWMIYFVLISMDQLRNQSALAVMMISVLPFITNKEKKLRKEILFLVIASLFHVSFFLFLIPLLLTYKGGEKFAKKWFIGSICVFFVLMATSSISVIDSILSYLAGSSQNAEKYEGYVGSRTVMSSLGLLGFYLFTLFSLYFARRHNNAYRGLSHRFSYENIDKFYTFMLYSSCLLIFLLVNSAFYRIPRDLSFIAIAYYGLNTTVKTSNLTYRLLILSTVVMISIGWFIFDIVIKEYIVDYYLHFFDNVIL